MNAKDSYQLVALDMDGTLLNTAHETTEYTRNALERAAKAGKVVALSTGRCLSELTEHLSAIPGIGYVIGENGACVYRASDFQMIHQVVLDDAEVAYAFEASRDLDAVCQAFIDNRSYMEGAFDESLTRMDENRLGRCFEVLRQEGLRGRQSIVMTCRETDGKLAAGAEGVNLIALTENEQTNGTQA